MTTVSFNFCWPAFFPEVTVPCPAVSSKQDLYEQVYTGRMNTLSVTQPANQSTERNSKVLTPAPGGLSSFLDPLMECCCLMPVPGVLLKGIHEKLKI